MPEHNLAWWIDNLPEADRQVMCVTAAKEHTKQFSNPEQIGMLWASMIRKGGYNSLRIPYLRNFLAHQYLDHIDAQRIKVY